MCKIRKKAIVDASFLRACDRNASQLVNLVGMGYTLVIVDTLLYELCSTNDLKRANAALGKLGIVANDIDLYEHVGDMLAIEQKEQHAYGHPYSEEMTKSVRNWLKNAINIQSPEIQDKVKICTQQREVDTIKGMFDSFSDFEHKVQPLREKLSNKKLDDVSVRQTCYGVVNDQETIRSKGCGFAGKDINDEWVTWHTIKSLLVIFCDSIRAETPSFNELLEEAKKRWVNRKHDLDYLICLHWADAIASNETTGEQKAYRIWMYGDDKQVITAKDCS